ncbi:putative lipid II flippase FtsW [Aquipuribacter hungaricus]|uniref:Probable peptidoglycan glycosyltransferase FtsW n=2 Tax=Aquipuribacter hungaricus TaxID=545624 RepID=A0ABV7WLB2_9MICO
MTTLDPRPRARTQQSPSGRGTSGRAPSGRAPSGRGPSGSVGPATGSSAVGLTGRGAAGVGAAGPAPEVSWVPRPLRRWTDALDTPVTSFVLVSSATGLLLVFGLLMVLSSSSVESYATAGNPWAIAGRQIMFAAIGLPLLLVAARLPVLWWKRLAWPALFGALFLQCLVFVPGLGFEVNGNRNWIRLAGFTAQPSEAIKLALVVWAAAVLARKRDLLGSLAHVLVPVVLPVGAIALGLVLAGHDLGTALVILLTLAGLLFAAGTPLRYFVLGGGVALAGVAALVLQEQHRVTRIQAWLSGQQCTDIYGECWQPVHGMWALASGGWWGLGLGASREKWAWLPEAHNDFIFAIVGEELGLPGTLSVLLLFVALAVGMVRVAQRTVDPFVAIATTGVMVWVLGQALINIGVVIGVLPVVGVPLPLVSSGGSSLVVTMVALGMVMSFARAEPGAREALGTSARAARSGAAVVADVRLPRARVSPARPRR